MKRYAICFCPLGLAVALGACSPAREAGVSDPDAFRASADGPVVTSSRSAGEVAECFEARAALLPMSAFTDDAATAGRLYRLRGFGRTFEEIVFTPEPSGGSTARVYIASNLDGRWRADFERDRGATLAACADGAPA